MASYSGGKRSAEVGEDEKENPSKIPRWSGEGDSSSDQQQWKRVSSGPPTSNPQLNFQQRVLAAAALQEIRASSPAASFKFPLDSSSSSSGLLDHLPPLSPSIQQQQQQQQQQPQQQRGMDSLYTPLLNLPPIVHQPIKLTGADLTPVNTGYQIHQPGLLLPPAPGLLGRDPCSWFTPPSSHGINHVNGGSGGLSLNKDGLLLPPYQDVMSSLMPPLPAFSTPVPDFQEQYSQQLNPSSTSSHQQHHQQQHHQQQHQQQQQQQQQQGSCSYRSELIPPPEMMFSSGNGFGSTTTTTGSQGNMQRGGGKMISQQVVVNTGMNGGLNVNGNSGKYAMHGGGSSYCSSEIAASSVTSVHNAAASSSNTTMQNGSPEDTTTLAQKSHHHQQQQQQHQQHPQQQHQHNTTTIAATTNQKQAPTRTYTKVYKLGSIGRAVDVTRFSNYTELRWELARMFNLEGQLDQMSGWQLVFIDHEGDILLVGDDPWEEFVTSVRGIRILSPSEVAFYTNNETGGAHSGLTSTGI